MSNFYILCRFCYSDFVAWVHNDPASMGDYWDVHSWDIPERQLREVRDDPDIDTAPSPDSLDADDREIYDIVDELGGDEGAPEDAIKSRAEESGMTPRTEEVRLNELVSRGHLSRGLSGFHITYLAAK